MPQPCSVPFLPWFLIEKPIGSGSIALYPTRTRVRSPLPSLPTLVPARWRSSPTSSGLDPTDYRWVRRRRFLLTFSANGKG